MSRRRFLATGLAAAGASLVLRREGPAEAPRPSPAARSGKTRWIGHF